MSEIRFTFQTQARALFSLESYRWYAYVRILLNNHPYAEFSSEGIAEFDTPEWAQGVAEMIEEAEINAAKRAIDAAAENLKNHRFGEK